MLCENPVHAPHLLHEDEVDDENSQDGDLRLHSALVPATYHGLPLDPPILEFPILTEISCHVQSQLDTDDGETIVTPLSLPIDVGVGGHGLVGRRVEICDSTGLVLGDGICGWN